tara:strand:+ start:40 stop:714 length:675 start_codon:yes stop_codon:yes gene_type:complete
MNVSVIIPSAGSGNRFGQLKQFKLLNGEPLVILTIKPFLEIQEIVEIIIVAPSNDIVFLDQYLKTKSYQKQIKLIEGGKRRQDSITNGLKLVDKKSKLVCIHDAVRPFITKDKIKACIKKCQKFDGAILGVKSTDTVKISNNNIVKKTIDREKVWLVQTPQVFNKNKLIKSIKNAEEKNINATDESFLMEKMGYKIKLIKGDSNNIKITFNRDWDLANYLVENF